MKRTLCVLKRRLKTASSVCSTPFVRSKEEEEADLSGRFLSFVPRASVTRRIPDFSFHSPKYLFFLFFNSMRPTHPFWRVCVYAIIPPFFIFFFLSPLLFISNTTRKRCRCRRRLLFRIIVDQSSARLERRLSAD